jgi:hypothetical protein
MDFLNQDIDGPQESGEPNHQLVRRVIVFSVRLGA